MSRWRIWVTICMILAIMVLVSCGRTHIEEKSTEIPSDDSSEIIQKESVYAETEESTEAFDPIQAELDELKTGYSQEEAEKDGCVVMYGRYVVAGQTIWKSFVEAAERNEMACVRIYKGFASIEGYVVYDLIYDGEEYCLYGFESYDENGATKFDYRSDRYSCLIYDTCDGPVDQTDKVEGYLLANDENVTLEGYFGAIVSSLYKEEYMIYYEAELIYEHWQ